MDYDTCTRKTKTEPINLEVEVEVELELGEDALYLYPYLLCYFTLTLSAYIPFFLTLLIHLSTYLLTCLGYLLTAFIFTYNFNFIYIFGGLDLTRLDLT